jgi:hypothetical protein
VRRDLKREGERLRGRERGIERRREGEVEKKKEKDRRRRESMIRFEKRSEKAREFSRLIKTREQNTIGVLINYKREFWKCLTGKPRPPS